MKSTTDTPMKVFTVGSKPLSERPLWRKALEASKEFAIKAQAPLLIGMAARQIYDGQYVCGAFFAAVATVFAIDDMSAESFQKAKVFLKDNVSDLLRVRRQPQKVTAKDSSEQGPKGPSAS